jgi:RNA polymerase sigma-70 factor (ECF subfamily)
MNNKVRYNKSRVFKTAWQIWHKDNTITWSDCLIQAWSMEKNGITIEEIYKKYYTKVYEYILYKVRNIMDAEDIAQDVFLRCNKHLAVYDVNKAKLITWLLCIANNMITDFYRVKKESLVSISEYVNSEGKEIFQISANVETDDNILNDEMSIAIKTAMSDLKPKHKEIAIMYFKQNLQYNEIAKVLEIPLNTVKVTIMRIREVLQSSLKHEYQLLNE